MEVDSTQIKIPLDNVRVSNFWTRQILGNHLVVGLYKADINQTKYYTVVKTGTQTSDHYNNIPV